MPVLLKAAGLGASSNEGKIIKAKADNYTLSLPQELLWEFTHTMPLSNTWLKTMLDILTIWQFSRRPRPPRRMQHKATLPCYPLVSPSHWRRWWYVVLECSWKTGRDWKTSACFPGYLEILHPGNSLHVAEDYNSHPFWEEKPGVIAKWCPSKSIHPIPKPMNGELVPSYPSLQIAKCHEPAIFTQHEDAHKNKGTCLTFANYLLLHWWPSLAYIFGTTADRLLLLSVTISSKPPLGSKANWGKVLRILFLNDPLVRSFQDVPTIFLLRPDVLNLSWFPKLDKHYEN